MTLRGIVKKSFQEMCSGSSGRVRGADKHEIYAAAFGGHLFYDLFLQGQGGPWPHRPPLDPLLQGKAGKKLD